MLNNEEENKLETEAIEKNNTDGDGKKVSQARLSGQDGAKDRKYHSVIEEMRRYVRVKRRIKVYKKDPEQLGENLITVLRSEYNTPNKDFSEIGSKFQVDKYSYEIDDYEHNKLFSISTVTKDEQFYEVVYKVTKLAGRDKYFIKYNDFSKTPATNFGMRNDIQKFFYRKAVKTNAKIITMQMKRLYAGKPLLTQEEVKQKFRTRKMKKIVANR